MKLYLLRVVLLSVCVMVGVLSVAQLSAPNRVFSHASVYSGADSVFFFSGMSVAQLKAVSEPGSSFRWMKYNVASASFDAPLAIDWGAESSFNPDGEGGYRVTIELPDGTVLNHSCWCFAPVIDSVTIVQSEATCYLLTLESRVVADSVIYYNPATNEEFREAQNLKYRWTTTPELSLYDPLKPHQSHIDAPVEDVTFNLIVTNEAGNVFESNFNHTALAVSAGYLFEVVDREWSHELGDESQLSAPATLRFENQSKGNITAYEWVFNWTLEDEKSTSRVYETSPVYTFQKPGNYEMLLTVTNERSGCSSDADAKNIKVLESSIEFPNVFTPNGDGVNDEFRPTFQSIKKYSIVIYSRWGRKVYESSDLSIGWDGKIGNGKAAEGVYYFVCEADGYLKGEHHRKKGSVTLLR